MILVTGGTGYIGSHTVVELLKSGHEVVVVDNFINSEREVLSRISKIESRTFSFEEVDVSDINKLKPIFEKYDIDTVIHFAAFKSVGESVSHPLMYYKNNIGSLISLLECCRYFQVENFIFSSSCTVYGEPSTVEIDENVSITEAASPYGNTKKVSEEIIRDFSKSNNFKAVLLRYFNPVGSHESGLLGDDPKGVPNNLIPYLTKVVDGELPFLNVFGNDYNTEDGTCIRDYIHVVELAQAHVKSIEYIKNITAGRVEPVNLGTGKGSSVLEVIHAFEKVTGLKVNYKMAPRRKGDVAAIYADARKAKRDLKWEASLSIEDMLESAWNYQLTKKKQV